MPKVKQIRIAGIGGQGLVLAGLILGHAAIKGSRYVAGSDSYGVRVRGGFANSDLVISDLPIIYPLLLRVDVLIPMAQEAYDTNIDHVADNGLVIFDTHSVLPDKDREFNQIGIPATSYALGEIHKEQVSNIIMLGALVTLIKIIPHDALISAIKEQLSEHLHDDNLKAAEIGFRLGGNKKWLT